MFDKVMSQISVTSKIMYFNVWNSVGKITIAEMLSLMSVMILSWESMHLYGDIELNHPVRIDLALISGMAELLGILKCSQT